MSALTLGEADGKDSEQVLRRGWVARVTPAKGARLQVGRGAGASQAPFTVLCGEESPCGLTASASPTAAAWAGTPAGT